MLEGDDFVVSESVGFGNDGYKVDFGVKPAHELYVDLLETMEHHSHTKKHMT